MGDWFLQQFWAHSQPSMAQILDIQGGGDKAVSSALSLSIFRHKHGHLSCQKDSKCYHLPTREQEQLCLVAVTEIGAERRIADEEKKSPQLQTNKVWHHPAHFCRGVDVFSSVWEWNCCKTTRKQLICLSVSSSWLPGLLFFLCYLLDQPALPLCF